VSIGPKHGLGSPLSVPKIDEDHATMIPGRIDPTSQRDFLTDVGDPEFVTMMSAVHRSHVCCN
jgi:hypothetical protein